MATYSRPGVYIQEVSLPQSVQLADSSNAVGAMAGLLPKGNNTTPLYVRSWSEFVNTFGGLNDSYPLTWAAYNFYANGGRDLYVRRVTGTGAIPATTSVLNLASASVTITATITAAAVPASSLILFTAANGLSAGQSVTVTGLGTSGSITLTSAVASGTAGSTTVTFAPAPAGLPVGSVVTVSGITGITAGTMNTTFYVNSVNGTTNFVATAATPATITGTAVVSSATVTYASGYNISGTVSATGLSSSQFNLAITPATGQFLPTVALSAQTGTATAVVTAQSVFTVNAINPGTWGNKYSIQVVPAGQVTRFGLNVYSTTGTTSTLVESFTDLSMDSTDKYYFYSVINTSSTTINISSTGINTALFPYTQSTLATTLAGGADGTTPLVRSDYSSAWTSFDSINNPLVIYAADAPYAATSTLTSQIHGDAINYAATRDDAFVIIDTPSGMSVSSAQAQITSTYAIASASTTGNIAAAYYPWVNIPDGNKIPGAVRLQAPGAAMVGQFLATDSSRGVFKSPAGLNNKIALAVSTDHLFTNTELDSLNTGTDPINAIRQVPGAGIVVMGARTLDNTANNRYINIRRSLIFIEKQIKDLSSFALFENNDSRLWGQLRTAINTFLLNYWSTGGLRGNSPTEAYYVKCDATTTSFADLQAGRVNIEVGVALEYPTEFVVIKLGQLTGNASA
ncbi:tail sheath protein [uncultured Caudovirales phage]|uniref:Tail sheath protein n=1 Tax=uncultured Caudovirales phage TaxID=2100421 RepID=A0A6J5KM14_9CAUD|nr:tail sheath protein [uncultured Caudovirales phage]